MFDEPFVAVLAQRLASALERAAAEPGGSPLDPLDVVVDPPQDPGQEAAQPPRDLGVPAGKHEQASLADRALDRVHHRLGALRSRPICMSFGCESACARSGVSTWPGQTHRICTPLPRFSWCSTSVNATCANFDAL